MKIAEFVSQVNEPELADRLRSGDFAAVEELYHTYSDKLYTWVLKQAGGDQAVAEDIVQETFLAALNSLDKFRGDSQLYTWLCNIAYHKISDLYRRQAREVKLGELPFGIEITELERDRDTEPTILSTMESEETRQAVRQALVSLPGDYRQVLTLKYIEGVPVLEISRIMSRSPKSVEGLLSRARRILRSTLAGVI